MGSNRRWILVAALSPALWGVVACDAAINDGARPGFAVSEVSMCDPATDSVPVTTAAGGVLFVELVDMCGQVFSRCEGPDLFAPDAQASIRIAGSDVLLEGCALSAIGAARLRASFRTDDGDEESYEVSLRGDCLAVAPMPCRDGGPPPPPPDTGVPVDGGAPDAAAADAAAGDGGP